MACVRDKVMPSTFSSGGGGVRRACAACKSSLSQSDFSVNQWRKGVGESRCLTCVQEKHFTEDDARSAARNNGSTEAQYDPSVVFDRGAHRNVYKGVYVSGSRQGQECVAKQFRDNPVFEESYFATDVAVIEKVLALVSQFNDLKIINKTIRLNKATVWNVRHTGERLLVEPFIENWCKFNSNSGWTAGSSNVWHQVMQALSHFSYHVTGGQFVVCDLQGGIYSNGVVLSDPVVLSQSQKFGPTDLGPAGISTFFSKHVCNKYCRSGWNKPYNPIRKLPVVKGTTMDMVPTQMGRNPLSLRMY